MRLPGSFAGSFFLDFARRWYTTIDDMKTMSDKQYMQAAWALIAGFTLFRIFYANLFLLVPDETNYWQWGRHLDWGYHDNSPLIGWTIRLSTSILGNSEMAVRMPSILSMTIVSLYLVLIARRWINARAAFHTAVLVHGVLEFAVGGLLATTDGLQAAAWSGACYHVARAYEEDGWSHWLFGGFWFGIGMLSKLTMVIFLPGAYLFGLLSPLHRGRLAGIRPYLGLALGFLMFLPVIFWNAAHGWNSARHVAHIGGANQGLTLHFKYLGEYLGGQAGLLSPLVFFLVLLAWHIAIRINRRDWIYHYLFWTSFPMFAGFMLLSFHTRVYANWPGAAYLTAVVLAAALFTGPMESSDALLHPFQPIGRKLWPWGVGTAYFLTALLLLHVAVPVLPLSKKLDRVAREISGWDQLGRLVAAQQQLMPRPEKTFLFGLRYQIASELAFYTPGQPETVSINKWKRPNVYDYWWKDEDLLGWDAVGVTYSPNDHTTRLKQVFTRVDPPVEFKTYRDPFFVRQPSGEPAQVLYIYRAYGFKGGLRWVPPDPTDIRVR